MGLIESLFKIERSELGKVLSFTILGILLQAGISIGLTASDTLFLSKIGADNLPYIYLMTPLVFMVYIPIYSYLTSRFGINQVFKITLVVLTLGGIAVFFLLNNFGSSAIYAAKLYSILWYIALYTLFWNFADGFFDILDAKRLFSSLSAGCALGAAIGGGFVAILSGHFSIDELFLFWSLLSVAAYPALCRCLKYKLIDSEITVTDSNYTIIEESKALIKTFRSSSFSVLLGSLLFLTMIVTLICEYQFSHILSVGRSEAELAKLFGTLFLAVNIFNLFINLFVFNRLALRFGVRNVALIQPVVYITAFVFFIFDQSFLAGIFGFFAFHGILTSIDYNNTNLLINALPKENKRQLRTFIEGVCEPMANAAAGVFLIYLVGSISPVQISSLGFIASITCLVLVIFLRGAYLRSMISNLKKSWLDFTASQTSQEVLAMTSKGLSGVPFAVKTLKNKSLNYKSRSIAARALSKLSEAQLESLTPSLIFEECTLAASYAERRKVFAASGRTSAGLEVLSRYCEDRQSEILEFVLELLALNGRVTNFELLLSNLRSQNKKERADAIETIQQACDARTNVLILTLINADKADYAQGSGNRVYTSDNSVLYESLKVSLDSPNELEASAAAEAFAGLGHDMERWNETESILRKRLSNLPSETNSSMMLPSTLFSAITDQGLNYENYTLIRKIALLCQSEFFQGFNCEYLRQIAEQSETIALKNEETVSIGPEGNAYINISGNLIDQSKNPVKDFSLIGDKIFFGINYTGTASAKGDVKVLSIPSNFLRNLINSDSMLLIWMLSLKCKITDIRSSIGLDISKRASV